MANGGKVPEANKMTESGAVVARVSWAQVLAFVGFIGLVAPALMATGALWMRVSNIEDDVARGILPNAEKRISVLEIRLDRLESTLEDHHDELMAEIHAIREGR
ncbi:MAG: hypothetical protein GY709_15935 [Herbaspirillum sp.]|nr:hypothetical protein [Herbaspirillum sp.]